MKKILFMLCTAALFFAACSKDETNEEAPIPAPSPVVNENALVLNQGSDNNASLTLINLATGEANSGIFATANGRGLGDLAEDVLIYGSKAYATVYGSNTLEVFNASTGESRRIDLGSRGPRYMAAYNGKIYISCYTPASVIRIDTVNYTIEATCELGTTYLPEGIAIANGKIVVASSYRYEPDARKGYSYDNHLYVVDLATFTTSGTIEVCCNPERVYALDANRVIVSGNGNYYNQPASAMIVDLSNNITTALPVAAYKMAFYNGNIYCYTSEYDDNWNQVNKYYTIDLNTLSVTEILSDCNINNAYGIGVNPRNGDIFVLAGSYGITGNVVRFSNSGSKLWEGDAGIYPCKILFF